MSNTKHSENLKMKKFMEQMQQAEEQHNRAVAEYKTHMLGKLVLVGVSGQGIERTFVTDVKHEFVGTIAIELAASGKAGDGMYFDAQQLRFYHRYDETETAKFVEEFNTNKKIKANLTILKSGAPVPGN